MTYRMSQRALWLLQQRAGQTPERWTIRLCHETDREAAAREAVEDALRDVEPPGDGAGAR